MMRLILKQVRKHAVDYMNNKPLVSKFVILFVFCVFIPIILSCIIFSYNINRNFYEREMDNLAFMVRGKVSDLSSIYDDAVAVSNVIANDKVIHEVAQKEFGSNAEYYDYLTEHNLRYDFSAYISQKDSIEDISVYLDNSTILNGEIIRRLTDAEKNKDIYKAIMSAENNIILCKEQYVKSPDNEKQSSYINDRLCFVRKLYRGMTGSNVFGYVKISLNMENLKKVLAKDTDYMFFYLVNEENKLIYDPQDSSFHTDDGFLSRLISDKNKIAYREGFTNISCLDGWSVIGIYDETMIMGKSIENIALVMLVNLLVGIVMLFVVYLVYCSYSDRISKLQVSMCEVEKEHFEPVDGNCGSDELGILTNTYNHMVNKINTLVKDVYQLEIKNKSIEVEKIRAELRALQSQVNPHFIFNVLNAILVMSVKNGYSLAVPQISGLSKMMRRLLDWSEDSEPLSCEMNFIETYLKLERFRFGERFSYDLIIENNADKCIIPKMVIQPIIENACRHGLQGLRGNRYVCVKADLCDNVLTVSVKDNGHGIPAEKLEELRRGLGSEDFTGHIGMKNVYRRLKLYFEDKVDMKIDSEENNGTEVIIMINYND